METPYDPEDITTWDAQQLDDLGVWAAVAEQGAMVVDDPLEVSEAPHGVNTPEDHDYTVGGEFDPYVTDRRS